MLANYLRNERQIWDSRIINLFNGDKLQICSNKEGELQG